MIPTRSLPITFICLLLAVKCFGQSPAASDERETVSGDPDRITLQLKWQHQFQSAGFYAAIEQGYYRDEGLDVTLRVPAMDEDPVRVVIDGLAEYGVATSDLLIARSRGSPVVALAPIYQHSPLALMARHDAGIETLHDLAGHKVMMEPQAASILAYLQDERVPMDSLDLVPHEFSPRPLIDSEVDAMTAYTTDEPFLLRKQGIEYRIFTPRSAGVDFYGDTLFTTENEREQHPDRVEAFVRASKRGWHYALQHPEKMADLILQKYSERHSREHLLFEAHRSKQLIAADIVELGYMNPGRWRYIADIYRRMGLMKSEVDMDAFLWNPHGPEDPAWFYTLSAFLGLLVFLTVLTATWFYRLNLTLRREMKVRQTTEEELRQSEERYRLLVNSAPFPVIITRIEDGQILFANPYAALKLGIDIADAGDYKAPYFYDDPDERQRLVTMVKSRGSVNAFEANLHTHEGEKYRVEISAARLQYEGEDCIFVAFSDITRRKELEEMLRRMADTDPLTDILNRRKFFELLDTEIALLKRYARGASILFLDLDNFKDINDEYGHPVGDDMLIHITREIQHRLRQTDEFARIGGEEFAIILRGAGLEEAVNIAEEIRVTIENAPLHHHGSAIPTTISIGATDIIADDSADTVQARADTALYNAKKSGRNRVCSRPSAQD